ncbi:MAG: 50S ribosomal protein L27 [Candidatus Omnitrophica bacterium]|nr:50S ribosomal protein L27 [Candidatus Omnitrophota bacterium]
MRVGGITKKYYKEKWGVRVAGGQKVKCGTILTREGDKWKSGLHVTGRMHLTAGCDGEVYFTRKMGTHKKVVTYIHVRPAGKT